jgi:hypothetical protein
MTSDRKPVLREGAMSWAYRMLWATCIAVYLTVFLGGIRSGGDELMTMGRAVAFTLAAGVLGKMALGLIDGASLPEEKGPSADELGPVGSRVDVASSTIVAHQEEDTADSASGER